MVETAKIIDDLKKIPLGTDLPEDQHKEMMGEDYRNGNSVVLDFLVRTGKIFWFDSEDGRIPPDYVRLLKDLCELTDGKIKPKRINQDDNDSPWVQVDFGDRDFILTMKDQGDYFDVDGIVDGMNYIAYQLGLEERFFDFPTGDQTAQLTFINEKQFEEFIEKHGIIIIEHEKAPGKDYLKMKGMVEDIIQDQKQPFWKRIFGKRK